MSTYETLAEKATENVTKRARYEALEFTVTEPGIVHVRNASYGDDADAHAYDVTVQHGEALRCTCPSDGRRAGPCQHRVAVSAKPALLIATSLEDLTIEDEDRKTDATHDVGPRSECWCAGHDLPCWSHFEA